MASIHPLASLNPSEIRLTSRLINNAKEGPWIFNSIQLNEPEKDLVLKYLEDNSTFIARKSLSVLIDPKSGKVYEVVVNLSKSKVESFEPAPSGSQPTLTPEDCLEAEKIVKTDPIVTKRCRELGLQNMDLVVADPWYGF